MPDLRSFAVLAASFVAFALPPCPSQADAADAPVSTLQRIADTGTIRIGYASDDAPFSYTLGKGAPIGYSIELCGRVVAHIEQVLKLPSVKIDYVRRTASDRVALLKNGTIDLECVASTNTAERRKSVSFSFSHFVTTSRFVSLKANNFSTVADLTGRTVTSLKGTTNIGQISAINRERNLHIAVLPSETHKAAFDMITDGRASAFVMDGILLATMIANAAEPDVYSLSSETLGKVERYGLMMRRDDEPFKQAVNAALAELYTSGEVEKIYEKWFMSPIPPRNINLHLPISDDLRQTFASPSDLH